MDEFEKIMEEAEREGMKASRGLNRLLLGMWGSMKSDVNAATAESKRLRIVSIVLAAVAAICIITCVFMGSEVRRQAGDIASLRGEIESIHKILDAGVIVEETTTTTETTTTVEQDTGEGSGNNVFQAGEGSSYTQDGGGE